ncbi:hypothetical protein [Tabrizicola sp.]|uniref:hypothetical protein n=1 Tax=Tabrizicola sp. TaxID=2005166 RepID=UPI002734FA05|nr:hypothetical protein [Tabrizicola sp.]MDP3195065.1 hypothetical protein [Tabrizicola sp.]
MRRFAALTLTLAFAMQVQAQTVLSEASGNWAGASKQGFHFLARLVQNDDTARLMIWGGALDGVPTGEGDPEFDNRVMELSAFATRQALEVVETSDGSILQVVVEFADEDAEGRSVTQLQYIDNQYTVVGYYHRSKFYNPGGDPFTRECEVDLWKMTSTEDGVTRELEPVGFEALNASDWTWGSAFDRGFCSRTE